MQWLIDNKEGILAAVGAVYTLASIIAAMTPSDKDDTVLGKIGAIADRIGLNLKGK